jgi:hypothetical protein
MKMTDKTDKSKTILIATKNNDKFLIVAGMMKQLGLNNYKFISLHDLNIKEDLKEKGTISDRAKQKANFYQKIILKKKIAGITAVLGTDDGIKLPGRKTAASNSKQITDKILSGELISIGETVSISRAFSLNLTAGNARNACVTDIPYVFLGNEENIKREEEKYPLNRVLSLSNGKKPLAATNEKECLEYYLKHSRKELELLCKILP